MSKTIVFRSDRTPQPGRVHVGFETDNMVERLAFVLPQLDAQQTAMLMLGGTYVNMVQLSEGGGVYYVDMTAELIGKAGEAEGYVVVNTPDGRVWNSAPFVLITGDLPDIDGELQEHFPDAIQQMRQEIAEHNAEMAEQAEAAHAAVNAAEAAAKRSETAAESFVEKDPTVPEWAKQPSKPVYSSEEVGAPSKAAFEALAAEVGKKQPAGDYASKDDIPTVPTKLSAFENDVGYAANLATWAKQPNKPTYTPAEVGAPSKQELNVLVAKVDNKQPKGDYALKSEIPKVTGYATEAWVGTQLAGYQPAGNYQPAGDYALKSELPSVPTQLSELAQDATHRLTTDEEKAAWNAKVKTVNGTAPDANGNVQIEAGGGVTSWNDLTERPFYEKNEAVYAFPETEVTGELMDGLYTYLEDLPIFAEAPAIINVVYDGVDYECHAIALDGNSYMYGNMSYMGGEDSGEPFLFGTIPNAYSLLVLPDSEPHTVSIATEMTIATPIEAKYIPTRVFYWNVGELDTTMYLYIDEKCQTKATKADVKAALDPYTNIILKGQYMTSVSGLITVALSYYTNLPICIYTEGPSAQIIIVPKNTENKADARTIYTAEFNPT